MQYFLSGTQKEIVEKLSSITGLDPEYIGKNIKSGNLDALAEKIKPENINRTEFKKTLSDPKMVKIAITSPEVKTLLKDFKASPKAQELVENVKTSININIPDILKKFLPKNKND
jgi:hypothetical protein